MTRVATLIVAMASAMAAAAQDATPQTSVHPKSRPENAPTVALPTQVATPQVAEKTDSGADPSIKLQTGHRELLKLDAAAYASCLVTLRELAVVYDEVPSVASDDDDDCGILQPVKVSQIAPGVDLVPPAIIRCPTAQALAAWVQDFVLPAAARLDGRGTLTAIENDSGYTSRRRNNQVDGALSEHAFGNAFDVMGFRFEQGAPVIIEPREAEDTPVSAFQDAIWASACLDFSTVLGPGSNASHEDHLHLDIKARDQGFRICELGGAVEK